VAQLLDIFGFLSVLLRGLTLAFEALTVGGVIFSFLIGPLRLKVPTLKTMLAWFAVLLAVAESMVVLTNSAILIGTTDLAWADVTGAGFFVAGALVAAAALTVAILSHANSAAGRAILPIASLLILFGSVMSSHSVSRLEDRWLLAALTFAHHLASAAWIGGMPYLIVSLRDTGDITAGAIVSRFSRMAMASVALLITAGIGMSYFYVGSPQRLGGTTYGIMLLAKVILTLMILPLGARNLSIVRALQKRLSVMFLPLRRFAEVEAGIGFTVLLAAASLTSTPPAADVTAVISRQEVAERMKPEPPLLETPPLGALSPPTPIAQLATSTAPGSFVPGQVRQLPNPADIAWSEYNHHWAGMVVLAMGLASLLARKFVWARYWPLLFLGLAAFLFLRADAENWPLGTRGFWESFQVAEVTQHRVFVLLIILFAVFEAAVQNSRLSPQRAGLVFPGVCALGGALLLTHSHSLINAKEEFLAELSHIPLALLGVAAGWSRWLEIRLPQDRWRPVKWIWPVCFVLVGVILLNYREH
jgi:putative copper resistance protein D